MPVNGKMANGDAKGQPSTSSDDAPIRPVKPEALTVTSGLKAVGPNIWTVEGRLKMFTICDIPVRMVVLGLPNPKKKSPKKNGPPQLDLLVYSPLSPTPEIISELQTIGQVQYIIVPNSFHYMWAEAFKRAYPSATLIAPKCVKAKHPDLPADYVFPSLPKAWPVDVVSLTGVPLVSEELVLVHKPSRSLVVADLAFNFAKGGETPPPRGLPIQAYLMLTGGYTPCSLTTPFKAIIKQPTAAQAALEKLLTLDFDQLVMSHGSIVTSGGKEALSKGTVAFVNKLVEERQAQAARQEAWDKAVSTVKSTVSEHPYWLTTGLVVAVAVVGAVTGAVVRSGKSS